MSKSTELPELEYAWHEQKVAIHRRTHSASGYLKGLRWKEICSAHKRKIDRQKRIKNRAIKVAVQLSDTQFWSEMIRSNRKWAGLPPQVFRFGNSGKAIE